jgi:SAM-dependent methyltransferase
MRSRGFVISESVIPLYEESTLSALPSSHANGSAHESIHHLSAFHHFLRAKRTVDDRALHRGVYAAMQQHLVTTAVNRRGDPLRVLEIGCGIGTMVERLSAWGLWSDIGAPVHYTALDQDAENLLAFPQIHDTWLHVAPVCADFFTYATQAVERGEQWDLVIAHAVLDLLDLEHALPLLAGLLQEQGVAWLTINFDGGTILLPSIDPTFDDLVEARYHRTMDERKTDGIPCGDSRTGRRLFSALPAVGLSIVAAGASDWIVTPAGGEYPADEQAFLHFIVATMQSALAGDDALDQELLAGWITARHSQIDDGKLTYLAKQYDFLVKRMSS